MKRRDLIRFLVSKGCYLQRHGKKHDIYANPGNGKKAPVQGTVKSKKHYVISLLNNWALKQINSSTKKPILSSE